jgi:RimJ/RimL family protein N-acetyltransferase
MPILPLEIRTPRLVLRPWQPEDAASLNPVLEANWEHLRWWIPARVATPAPVPVLAERLAGFAADFAADKEWRFGMFAAGEHKLLGEVGVFPRSATGRVPVAQADRAELGYWLRVDETGRGIATEAARALFAVVAGIPRFSHVEIRCDPRNAVSAAVAQRLGFELGSTISELSASGESYETQVWLSERFGANAPAA